jgi:hypothetical protein
MAIKFSCGSCGKKFTAKDGHAGRQSKCPACGRGIVVPIATARGADDSPKPIPPPIPHSLSEVDAEVSSLGVPTKTENPVRKSPAVPIIAGLAMLGLAGLLGYSLRGREPSVAPQHARLNSVRSPRIPVEVSFSVIDENFNPPRRWPGIGQKRTVSVRLNIKVSKEVLREIATQIQSEATEQYEITDINFYLPGQVPGMGAWAWTRLPTTNGDIEIAGLTIEQEQLLLSQPLALPQGSVTLGTWLLEDAYISHRFTVYRVRDAYYRQIIYPGGEPHIDELNADGSPVGLVLSLKKKGVSDRYYVMDEAGEIQEFSRDGKLFAKPKLIKAGK